LGGSLFVAAPPVIHQGQPPAAVQRPQPAAGAHAPLLGVPFCGEVESPGMGQNDPVLVDYSQLPGITADQARIEDVLDGMDLKGRAILHVGIGRSSLAARFHARCSRVDGLTVSQRELERAGQLKIPNYRAWRISKYSTALMAVGGGPYDFIVDNNLASFACCEFHLLVMFSNYRLMLKPGGQILTDQQGMEWSAGDPKWRLRISDLVEIARRFSMNVVRHTETVFAMVKR
jgi:hypothetical protein